MKIRSQLLDSIWLLAVLTGLYPGLFLVSKNWFMLGAAQSVYLILSLVAATLPILLILHFLLSHTSPARRVARTAIALMAVYLLSGYLDFVIVDLERRYAPFNVRAACLVVFGATAALLILASWRRPAAPDLVRLFNVGLSVMTLMAFLSLALSVAGNYFEMFTQPSADPRRTAIYDKVRFQTTPNIYLLIPDSYPSNRVLERLFHFDNGKFSGELQSLGFRLHDDYFSSYPYSVESMHSMLSMTHNYFQKTIGNDAIGLREVIAGRNSDSIKILANNGYKSVFIHETDYLFPQHCYIERCLPEVSTYGRLRNNLQNHHFFNWLPATSRQYNVVAEMKNHIRSTPENSRTFTYGHFMEAHSIIKSFGIPEATRRSVREGYPGKIAKVNQLLLDQIKEISNHDPSAIIIVAGDHGTWAGAVKTDSAMTPDETLDKFNVFLAIRWGEGYKGQYDGKIKSAANLFRYIFAYLSESESILETRVGDESYLVHRKVYKVVQDGAVIEKPEPYTPD